MPRFLPMNTQILNRPLGPDEYRTSECTSQLRWRNGVLQQLWISTAWEFDSRVENMRTATGVSGEWRDVPQVKE